VMLGLGNISCYQLSLTNTGLSCPLQQETLHSIIIAIDFDTTICLKSQNDFTSFGRTFVEGKQYSPQKHHAHARLALPCWFFLIHQDAYFLK
ncbi:hypothetical protein AVEN_164183-1, partial [Araneus ventricosus]